MWPHNMMCTGSKRGVSGYSPGGFCVEGRGAEVLEPIISLILQVEVREIRVKSQVSKFGTGSGGNYGISMS